MIEVEGLTVDLGGRTVLHDVSFTVPEGSTTAIVGPNGSGKTTLIRAISRVIATRSGRIRLAGTDLEQLDTRSLARRVAVLRQEPELGFEFTVRELVGLGRSPHKGMFETEDDRDREIIDRALEMTDTKSIEARSFSSLSGGEKQRTLLARALAQGPTVLLLDEPTNHLDIGHQLDLLERIGELGLTVLAALHDLNLARRFAREAICLFEGRAIAQGAVDEVLTTETVERAFGVKAELLARTSGAPVFAFDPRRSRGSP